MADETMGYHDHGVRCMKGNVEGLLSGAIKAWRLPGATLDRGAKRLSFQYYQTPIAA
jgi:hypothetical protein